MGVCTTRLFGRPVDWCRNYLSVFTPLGIASSLAAHAISSSTASTSSQAISNVTQGCPSFRVLEHSQVIDRPRGSCGVCELPEVLRGGAEQSKGYHIHHSFRGVYVACTTVDCHPPITGREKLGRALLIFFLFLKTFFIQYQASQISLTAAGTNRYIDSITKVYSKSRIIS